MHRLPRLDRGGGLQPLNQRPTPIQNAAPSPQRTAAPGLRSLWVEVAPNVPGIHRGESGVKKHKINRQSFFLPAQAK